MLLFYIILAAFALGFFIIALSPKEKKEEGYKPAKSPQIQSSIYPSMWNKSSTSAYNHVWGHIYKEIKNI